MILENGVYVDKDPEIYEDTVAVPYGSAVEALIRRRYSVGEELAIQRQRDTKPEEFREYFTYCEECKALAREQIGGDLNE